MGYMHDLTGLVYGAWRVIRFSHKSVRGEIYWLCECDCGTRRPVQATTLRMGASQSCGCRSKDWCRKHGMEGTSTYMSWVQMVRRCHNPKANGYQNYGGRGIIVCQRWRDAFLNFLADMGPRPNEDEPWSIGRVDNNGNYEPSNCRWETNKQQMRNRRNTKYLTMNGETKPLAEWAEIYSIPRRIMAERIRIGWEVGRAITQPHRPKLSH